MYILPIIITYCRISPLITYICYGMSLFTLASRLLIEVVQVMAEGADYLKSFWNVIDVTQIIVFTLVAALDLSRADDQVEAEGNSPTLVLLRVVLICQAFGCVLYYIRVFESVGFYVKMVADTLSDLRAFVTFYMIWVAFYMTLYIGFDLALQYDVQDRIDFLWP